MIFKLIKKLFTPPRHYLVENTRLPKIHFENDPEFIRSGSVPPYNILAHMWRLRTEHAVYENGEPREHTVRLAPGWLILPHARQHDARVIRDHRNRIRGQLLFGGAALYVYCRYQFELGYDTPDGKYHDGCKVRCYAFDSGLSEILYRTEAFHAGENDSRYETQVYEWLERRFPDYRNPFAYWN